MASPSLPPFLFLLFFFFFSSYFPFLMSAPTATFLLPLRHHVPPPTTNPITPYDSLNSLARASLLRAHYLRHPSSSPLLFDASLQPSAHLPLSPHSYGGYTLDISFGTPPQRIPLLLDTGSHLVWLPCTPSYSCRHCSSAASNGQQPVFLPKSSSSARLVGCHNPKCSWIHSRSSLSDCHKICRPYIIIYGSGSTGGYLLSDTIRLPGLPKRKGFAVGCSVLSIRQPPSGVAAFGRGPASLPSQLRLKRFSYCLVSRRYDDMSGKAGSVVLDGPEPPRGEMGTTHFVENPRKSPFDIYYYVALRKIVVDGRKVRGIPRSVQYPSAGGDGGTIVDSGSTLTFMERKVFEVVAAAVEEAVGEAVGERYNRSHGVEVKTGLGLCFKAEEEDLTLPTVELHFKGGATMVLPPSNSFAAVGKAGDVCFMVVSGGAHGKGSPRAVGGPSVIIGGFQQQDYEMVFEVEKNRLRLRRKQCLET